ncbi:MAG: TetR/AcrR family transcriptional regulator [Oscillibacter sp.]|uniref:TetR/AcrR family transcriptional regulator n=1 Tax=Oscillibacter sp. TaxID=1945593 RepID=UPI00132BA8F6|nr:TetR/AcrR family transcriptional regulator [Oscillibacter sp.]MUU10235.1 TetR/AcrR family transcriptional regulator [Oscillibacter sp.]
MPSSTFLNLPAEKQEKLLEAATREFSHRPFNEASINQIIKEAGIPGQLYMYFQDKEDLFRYLLKGYVDQLFMLLEEFLLRNGGDIFRRCWICMITCRQKSTISTWERSAP